MDDNILPRDQNHVTAAGFESSSTPGKVLPGQIDENTGRILVDNSGGGSGTVTSFSFTDGNGFDGTVTNATTTPALSLTTTVTNGALIKSNSGALAAATAGTDYTSLAFKTISVSGQSDVVADTPEDTLTLAAGANITITTNAGTDTVTIAAAGAGTGDVSGPASSTDNAVARFDGTTGKLIQNSAVTIADTTGDITGGKYNGLTVTTSTGTLTIANGKTLTASNTLTFTGTDSSSVNFGSGGTVLYTASTIPLTVGSTTIASGTDTKVLFDNAGVLGEYTISGTGNVAMTTNPTLSGFTMADATNIVINTGTGTKIGTGTTQKLAFYNATPVVQQTGDVATALSTLGLVATPTVAATTISTATENTDTTCFPVFVTASGTQTLPAKTNTTLTYNSNTNDLGVTKLNGLTVTASTGTFTLTNAKTLAVTNSLTLSGTDSTTMTFPTTTATIARTDAAQTFTGLQTFSQILTTPATISVSSNAGTVTRSNRINNFTNSSAATMTITMSTTGATDGDMVMVVILDASAAAQTITWVNTEDSTVTAPTTSNGSTTLPLTVGFKWNAGTSKWRCIAKA